VRIIGNQIFAMLLGVLSKRAVRDTASGMRVLRREALADLYPLPTGLHFTPAMSARALLEGKLRLVEVSMPYAERVGRSKLSVVRDGVRFLDVILRAAFCYRPSRPLLLGAGLLAFVALLLAWLPTWFYLGQHRLEEWMIYRLLLASLLISCGAQIAAAAVVAERIAAFATGRDDTRRGVTGALSRLFSLGKAAVAGAVLTGFAVTLTWPGLAQWLETGRVEMHWSRAMLASLLLSLAVAFALATFLLRTLDLLETQRLQPALREPDEVHPARQPVAP
jgi:hypothetical protein